MIYSIAVVGSPPSSNPASFDNQSGKAAWYRFSSSSSLQAILVESWMVLRTEHSAAVEAEDAAALSLQE